jgi:hypothetical protein
MTNDLTARAIAAAKTFTELDTKEQAEQRERESKRDLLQSNIDQIFQELIWDFAREINTLNNHLSAAGLEPRYALEDVPGQSFVKCITFLRQRVFFEMRPPVSALHPQLNPAIVLAVREQQLPGLGPENDMAFLLLVKQLQPPEFYWVKLDRNAPNGYGVQSPVTEILGLVTDGGS